MSKILLEVKNLKKYFQTPKGQLHAVDNVNFAIEEGKTLGVVGESGCGKSTTGRTILRLLEATDGEILFEGKNIREYSKAEMKKLREEMQIIFQDPFASLNPRMTVSEIIAEPLIIHKKCKTKEELNNRVKELMDTVGLSQRLVNTYPHELDGGRRQRIGIARALALNPKFIVCDEPVSALDVSIQAQVLNLMKDLQEKLGLQKSAIAKYEKGRVTNIKRETIHLMSKLFNVNPTWLMGFDVPIKTEEKDEVKTAARDKKVFDKYSKLDEAKRKIVEALIDSYFDENVEDEED